MERHRLRRHSGQFSEFLAMTVTGEVNSGPISLSARSSQPAASAAVQPLARHFSDTVKLSPQSIVRTYTRMLRAVIVLHLRVVNSHTVPPASSPCRFVNVDEYHEGTVVAGGALQYPCEFRQATVFWGYVKMTVQAFCLPSLFSVPVTLTLAKWCAIRSTWTWSLSLSSRNPLQLALARLVIDILIPS
jgi:hypothetical protein